jgi:hypothetical protein
VEDHNKEEEPFTPSTLQTYEERLEKLRHDILFDTDDAGADPIAEQQYLIALAHLETAQRHMALARLSQVRALAGH